MPCVGGFGIIQHPDTRLVLVGGTSPSKAYGADRSRIVRDGMTSKVVLDRAEKLRASAIKNTLSHVEGWRYSVSGALRPLVGGTEDARTTRHQNRLFLQPVWLVRGPVMRMTQA